MQRHSRIQLQEGALQVSYIPRRDVLGNSLLLGVAIGVAFPTIPWIMAPTHTLGRPGVRVAAVPVTCSPIQLVELILHIQQGAAHPLQHPLHPR